MQPCNATTRSFQLAEISVATADALFGTDLHDKYVSSHGHFPLAWVPQNNHHGPKHLDGSVLTRASCASKQTGTSIEISPLSS